MAIAQENIERIQRMEGYLNVYAKDVLKGTKGFPEYDNTYEEALEYGNSLLKESY